MKIDSWVVNQWLKEDGSLTDISVAKLKECEAGETRIVPRAILGTAANPSYLDLETYEPKSQLPDVIEKHLYDYQRRPARMLLDSLIYWGGAWDLSDMGTGKTAQCLAAAVSAMRDVYVVCPKSVKSGWARMARIFGVDVAMINNYEALRSGKNRFYAPKTGWKMPGAASKSVIILDEAHYCQNPDTANSGLLRWAVTQGIPTICASATIATRPGELEVTGQAIKLHSGGKSFDDWLSRAGCYHDKYKKRWEFGNGSATRINRRIFLPESNGGKIIPPRGVRVRIQDLGDRFPETQIVAESYDVEDSVAKGIDEAFLRAKQRLDVIRLEKGDAAAAKGSLAEFTRAWHESELLKVPAIVEMARGEIDAGRSVPIFMNFDDSRQAVASALGCKAGLHGQQNDWQRAKSIDLFQTNRERVIVCNLTAGGVGVSLHDTTGDYPRTAIILPNPRAKAFRQAFGRAHRAGGKSPSIQRVFFAAGTIEERICESVREALKDLDSLNDGWVDPPSAF